MYIDTDECQSGSIDDMINEMDMTYDEYIKIIRSSVSESKVFLKRKPNEVWINAYMKDLIHVWRANHDIQFVNNACAMYIANYINKIDRGLSLFNYVT